MGVNCFHRGVSYVEPVVKRGATVLIKKNFMSDLTMY